MGFAALGHQVDDFKFAFFVADAARKHVHGSINFARLAHVGRLLETVGLLRVDVEYAELVVVPE